MEGSERHKKNRNAEHLVMERHYLFLLVTVLRPRMLSVQGLAEHKKLDI